MKEHDIQVENVYFRLFHDVTRLVVAERDVRSVENHSINSLKVPHTHPFYEAFVCLDRSIVIDAEEGPCTVNAGDVLIVPPGVLHAMRPAEPDIRWQPLHFTFSEKSGGSQDLFSDLHRFYNKDRPILIRGREEEAARIFRVAEMVGSDRVAYLASAVADILIRLCDGALGEAVPQTNGVKAAPVDNNIDIGLACRIENLLAAQYVNDITAKEAAALLHVSVRQLDRLMVKYKNMTFRQAITLRRLRVAVELFETTHLTVEQIGSVIGFPSRVSFTRAFTAQYGMPPGRYRRLFCSGRKKNPPV